MRTSDFDYTLPPELIAQAPLDRRDAARLLVVERGTSRREHGSFRDLGTYLRAGDLLVVNRSRVIPARLVGRRVETGGRMQVLLLRQRNALEWEALVKPGRRLRPGARLEFAAGTETALEAEITASGDLGTRILTFARPVEDVLPQVGRVPLPPYIHAPLLDPERYQTVYARDPGSAAAPTAGLHFTPELLRILEGQGVGIAYTTLHVGLDTFRPVQEEEAEQHPMHAEWCEVDAEAAAAIAACREAGGRLIAVGTTVVRTLESAARATAGGRPGAPIAPWSGWTRLFLYPGAAFLAVDAMITNFHLPRSTLLMLVSAFAGRETILAAYAEAITRRYRFYSFGDAMLIY